MPSHSLNTQVMSFLPLTCKKIEIYSQSFTQGIQDIIKENVFTQTLNFKFVDIKIDLIKIQFERSITWKTIDPY